MADLQRPNLGERDVDQAITALKKGSYLLKYGRRGKPKFCPFRLSSDESMLIWYNGKEERQLELHNVSRIIPGQRTPIFQRYPRPEKEYQSFSLIHSERSLDLICKDKDEAEVWFVGLKALIARGGYKKVKNEASDTASLDSPRARKVSPFAANFGESVAQNRWGKAFADIVTYTATTKNPPPTEPLTYSPNSLSYMAVENFNGRSSGADTFRVSLSSAVTSSSQGSCNEDFDSLGDVFVWGEGTGDGLVGGGVVREDRSYNTNYDASLPKALESSMLLDVHRIACGDKHAVLVTKQGEVFSWGEEMEGRLGHGIEADLSHPKLIEAFSDMNIETVACGQYHNCAVTVSGELYSWGDGTHCCGLLGHGREASHWIPKKVCGPIEGLHVSFVSCGPWHTALITSTGQLFTFGDGTFGALGHGDRNGCSMPREVETLKGLRSISVSCGVWHTSAVVELTSTNSGESDGSVSGKLFTWGDGDKGRLGHGDNQSRLNPECVALLVDVSFCQVASGSNHTVALTTSGRVYTTGCNRYGQLGNPTADGKSPTSVEGKIADRYVEKIACGSHHVAVLTSRSELYTWGKGRNGQLGHGDNADRNSPTLVDFLKDRQVKSIACGSKFTAAICLHKGVTSADNSVCFGCHNPFNFRRKRHNCYNCGLVFCKACSSRKSVKASLAPSANKPYRVCDDCFNKLQKVVESSSNPRVPKVKSGTSLYKSSELIDKEGSVSGSGSTPRLSGHISKLSSSSSFKFERSSNCSKTSDSSDNYVFTTQLGNVQRVSTSSYASNGLFGNSFNFFSASVPSSRMASRSSSPVPRRSSPLKSARLSPPPPGLTSEITLDDLKRSNDSLSQEVKHLRSQVEERNGKTQVLEAELERKSKQLKEVTAYAAGEAEKRKAAKEVIKSLTAQLREISGKEPDRHITSSNFDSKVEHMPKDAIHHSNGSNRNSITPPKSESPPLANGTNSQVENPERIIQDEPGVYVTLVSLPDGFNELRRVRFSRKCFTEDEAEKWWAVHEARICEKYKIKIVL